MTYRLTLLEQMRVVRDDGKDLGRFMDLRTRARLGPVDGPASLAVDALLIGAAGWLERLGIRDGGSDAQPNAVIAVEHDRIVVRGARRDRAKPARERTKRR